MTDSTAIIPITAKSVVGGAPQRVAVPHGGSLADMLALVGLRPAGLHIFIDDRLIEPALYTVVRPMPGEQVFVCIVPQGGGGNKVLRTVAMIGVMILSVITQQYWLNNVAGATLFGATMAGAAVGMIGSLLVNALIPPVTPDMPQLSGSALEKSYSITGARNQLLPFGSVPTTLGTDRVYPPYAALPYTHVEGNKQWIYMLFCLGRGPMDVSDPQFGDTSALNYDAEIHYGTGAHPPRYFDGSTVKQTDLSILLDATGEGHTGITATEQTTDGEIDRIGVELYSPALYYARRDGVLAKVEITIEMRYREHGATTWLDCSLGRGHLFDENVDGEGNRIRVYGYSGTASRFAFFFRPPGRGIYDISIRRIKTLVWCYTDEDPGDELKLHDDLYLTAIRSILWESLSVPDDMEMVSVRARATEQLHGVPDDFNVMIAAHHPVYTAAYPTHFKFHGSGEGFAVGNGTLVVDNKYIHITADDQNYLRDDTGLIVQDDTGKNISFYDTDFTLEKTGIAVDSGDCYIVEIRYRITGIGSAISSRLYWSNAGHGFSDSYYMEFSPTAAGAWETIELDMRVPTAGGSNWINNTVTGIQLKFFAQDRDESYDIEFLRIKSAGSNDWTYKPTSNPAWIYADLLTGSANHRATALSNLDTDGLPEWALACETHGYAYNGTVSDRKSFEMMRVVCSAGRASWHLSDGKYSVIYDGEQTEIAQVFSPRNSWGFKGHKPFVEMPHALRVSFRDSTNGYQPAERIVYDDGYNESNATKFESAEYDGIVDPTMIWKYGRYDFASARLRPENYELNVDIEYLVADRGKRVQVAHDVPMWGTGWARIKSVAIDGTTVTLTLDDIVVFETGEDYAILIRVVSGNPISVQVDHPGAMETSEVTCTLPPASSALIGAGDMLLFGENDRHYQDLIIKAIQPMGDLAAKLLLVDYKPDIYDDATVYGTIPDYDANITLPVNWETMHPPVPVIDTIVSDESVLIVQANGVMVSQMVVSYGILATGSTLPATMVECQYRLNTTGSTWMNVPPVSINSRQVVISNVKDGENYIVRIRFVSSYGVPSGWAETTHTVIGKASPPPQVIGFQAVIIDNQVELRWNASSAPDIKDYELRYGDASATWDSASSLGRTDSTSYRAPARWSGTRYFFIKAVDTSENPSDSATVTDLLIVPPSVSSITAEVIDNNVLFRWVNVPGTLPIDHVELRKGAVFATASVIGEKKGTFTTTFENVSGQYKYWIVGVDTAGNYGPESSITATVNEPPDYILNVHWEENFAEGETLTNVLVLEDGTAIAPANTTETVAEHFTGNGATCVQDLIDAGYTYAIEPVPTSAEFAQEFDYGADLPSTMVTLDLDTTPYNGGATIIEYLAEKLLHGDDWNEGTDNPAYWTNFRYVRDRFAITSDGKKFSTLNSHSLRLDSRRKSDNGTGSVTTAATGVVVNFNKTFVDISSITVTPKGTTAIIGIYDFTDTPNPTSFTVYLFDTSGTKITGDFSWNAEGY